MAPSFYVVLVILFRDYWTEIRKTIAVGGFTFGFSLVPTLDLAIKFLQFLSLLAGLIYVYYQVKKIRFDLETRRRPDGSIPVRNSDDVGL